MATKKISPETQTTVLELTGKFGPQGFISKLFGSSGQKKDMMFTGKAKVVKGKDTASKIKPLQQGNDLLDMLLKIYTFLQKNFDEDKLAREKENNFKEEELIEAQKRHEKLLAALEELKKNLMPKDVTAVPESKDNEDNGPSIFDSLLEKLYEKLFGDLEQKLLDKLKNLLPKEIEEAAKKTALSKTGQLFSFLVGETALVPAFMFSLPWFMAAKSREEIDADPWNKKFDGIPYAQVARGKAKTQGEAAAQYQRDTVKRVKTKEEAKLFAESDLTDDELIKETGSNRKQLLTFAKSGKTQDLKDSTGSSNINLEVPKSPTPSTPSAEPKETPPPSEKLNTVTNDNNTAKINALPAPPSVSTINNTIQSGGPKKTKVHDKIDVPHVRNQEETFQKMILYSTRVV